MLECVSFKSLTPSSTNLPLPPPSHSQGNSSEDSPATSPNVSREFDRAVLAHSYNEIRTMIQAPPQVDEVEVEVEDDEDSQHRRVLSQVLQPDPRSVNEALAKARPSSTLTRLVSTYFDHSETTSDFCLRLSRSINRTRLIYAPLSEFLSVIPTDSYSLSQPQCDRAYDLFFQFDRQENPFVVSSSHQLRDSFSDLKRDIQRDLRRCHSRIRLLRHATAGCAVCLIAIVAGTVVSAALIATHAAVGFTAIASAPFCNACVPRPKKSERKEHARLKQLEVVENGTLVVNDINTIDSLVDRLQTAVEGDKAFVRFALERGRDRHPIREVLKQLQKNHPVLEQLLRDLEQHIYFCFYTVNKARRALLEEICLHQTL